jgi:hypothetical protein
VPVLRDRVDPEEPSFVQIYTSLQPFHLNALGVCLTGYYAKKGQNSNNNGTFYFMSHGFGFMRRWYSILIRIYLFTETTL